MAFRVHIRRHRWWTKWWAKSKEKTKVCYWRIDAWEDSSNKSWETKVYLGDATT